MVKKGLSNFRYLILAYAVIFGLTAMMGCSNWYRDADGDGYGDPKNVIWAETKPDGYVADKRDCDDYNDDTYPGATEYCADGQDNDCNGVVDEAGCDDTKVGLLFAGYRAFWICSGVFVSGMDESTILDEDLVQTMYPPTAHAIDYDNKIVTGTYGGIERSAVYRPGLGCTLVQGTDESELRAQTYDVVDPLPEYPESVPWPTGDLDAVETNPPGVDIVALNNVVNGAFGEPDPGNPVWTRAVVIVYQGKIIAERYAPGITMNMPLISWSVTKSLTSTLIGLLVGQGAFSVDDRAPIAEWDFEGDPRKEITLNHLLHMGSGLEFDENYTGVINDTTILFFLAESAGKFAINKPLAAGVNTTFSYSSGTTSILCEIIKRTLGREQNLSFPRTGLFNPIGMRSAVLSPDLSGSFLGAGFCFASARDWARYGLLYLQDGMWEGERVLPEGWVDYTRTPADHSPYLGGYGAQFWLNSPDGTAFNLNWPDLPVDTYYGLGFKGQYVVIIPSLDLIVVRLGMTHGNNWNQGQFTADIIDTLPGG